MEVVQNALGAIADEMALALCELLTQLSCATPWTIRLCLRPAWAHHCPWNDHGAAFGLFPDAMKAPIDIYGDDITQVIFLS